MLKALRALTLLLALAVSAQAGEIPCPPAVPPPSAPAAQAPPGEMHTPPLIEIALMLLALV